MGGVEQELLARTPAFSQAPPLLSKGAAWPGLERRNRETSLSKCSCAATWLHLLTAHTPITALSRFRGHPPPPMPGPGVSASFPEGRAWAPRLSRRYGRPLRCAEPPAWGGGPSGLRLVETSTGRRPDASPLPGRGAGCRWFTASLKESSLTPTDTNFHPVRLLTLNSAQEEN